VKYLLAIILVFAICFSANIVRAPNIPAVQEDVIYQTGLPKKAPSIDHPEPHLIFQIPDLRSVAGSPGKNIAFAEDGNNISVIYSRFGDPDNFFQVYVAYSTDRGESWIHYGPLSTMNVRRSYPGVDAEENWPDPSDLRNHFTWQQTPQIAGSYDSSPAFYAKEVMYPDGLITAAYRLPNSGTWDVWFPCIGVKDSFVIITAGNNATFITTEDCYIWRSTDYGETWDDGRVFFPGPLDWEATPHFRFGSDGYMFFLWNREQVSNPDILWPYFCESFDYGVTWTQPQLIWQNNPPYQDMSNVKGWWYMYDCEVVNDTPVAAIKLGSENYDYGEIWVYRPVSGGPGSWQFEGTKLVGGDSTSPQTYARFPTVAADDNGSIFIGYQAIFETPSDTGQDCGLFVRPVGHNNWYDWDMITHNAGDLEENHLEFAHNAPIIGTEPNDSVIVGMIYHNASDYPTTGNLYFDYKAIAYEDIRNPGVAESRITNMRLTSISAVPNPFQNSVKFLIPAQAGETNLSIYDITGKMVIDFNGNSELVWNGRNSDGSLARPGIYFYHISTTIGIFQGKVILTK
jgi:hypothetical protein